LNDEKNNTGNSRKHLYAVFVGLKGFQTNKIFDASLFATIQKRIGKIAFDDLNSQLIKSFSHKKDTKNFSKKKRKKNHPPNRGKLQADTTVADQYITFPTDVNLLNSIRKNLDEMIDKLYDYHNKGIAKPRIYKRTLDTAF